MASSQAAAPAAAGCVPTVTCPRENGAQKEKGRNCGQMQFHPEVVYQNQNALQVLFSGSGSARILTPILTIKKIQTAPPTYFQEILSGG
jgi:hypothetical protein